MEPGRRRVSLWPPMQHVHATMPSHRQKRHVRQAWATPPHPRGCRKRQDGALGEVISLADLQELSPPGQHRKGQRASAGILFASACCSASLWNTQRGRKGALRDVWTVSIRPRRRPPDTGRERGRGGQGRTGQKRVSPQSWLLLVVPRWRWSPRTDAAACAGQWELWLSRVVVVWTLQTATVSSCVYRRMRLPSTGLGPD